MNIKYDENKSFMENLDAIGVNTYYCNYVMTKDGNYILYKELAHYKKGYHTDYGAFSCETVKNCTNDFHAYDKFDISDNRIELTKNQFEKLIQNEDPVYVTISDYYDDQTVYKKGLLLEVHVASVWFNKEIKNKLGYPAVSVLDNVLNKEDVLIMSRNYKYDFFINLFTKLKMTSEVKKVQNLLQTFAKKCPTEIVSYRIYETHNSSISIKKVYDSELKQVSVNMVSKFTNTSSDNVDIYDLINISTKNHSYIRVQQNNMTIYLIDTLFKNKDYYVVIDDNYKVTFYKNKRKFEVQFNNKCISSFVEYFKRFGNMETYNLLNTELKLR